MYSSVFKYRITGWPEFIGRLCHILLLMAFTACSTDVVAPLGEQLAAPLPFSGEFMWARTFGGSGDDTFYDIINTTDGGFAAVGTTNSTDGDLEGKALPAFDYWLVKYDHDGNMQWSKTYGGSLEDRGQAVVQTTDGGYAITGYAMSSDGDASNNEGFHDNWIIKLDSNGNLQWEKSFGFPGHDHSYDLLQTADGGFFFVGFLDITASNGEGNYGKYASLTRHGVGEFWGTKVDADGNLQWRRYYGGTNNDRAHAVVQADDGGYVLAGFSESVDYDISGSKGSYDFWVIKIGSNGDLLWEHSYGGTGIEIAYDITKTDDGGYAVVGNTFSIDTDVSSNHGESDVWLLRLSADGNLLWERTYGGTAFDAAEGITLSGDNGFIITGNSKSADGDATANNGENDLWVLKTDRDGNLEWQENYGGAGLEFGFQTIETAERDLILAGETASAKFDGLQSKGNTDAVLVRIASGLRVRQ